MLVKKYEAKDMKQAMDDIIRELGTEAVILNSRKIRKRGFLNLFRKPIMEVMVAYEPKKNQPIRRTVPDYGTQSQEEGALPGGATAEQAPYVNGTAAVAAPPAAPSNDTAPTSLSEIDSKITSLDHALSEFMDKFSYIKRDITHDFPEAVEQVYLTMVESQVREELALSLAKETGELLRTRPEASAQEVALHLLTEYMGPPATIVPKRFRRKVILFLGPTGVGKTTSLVKLASEFAVRQKKRVGIINTDTYRIAAHEQLKTYADILDIPLAIAYRSEEVVDALADMADRDVIFIDTAGKRPGDPHHREEVEKLLQLTAPEEVLLCISATTGFHAVKEIIDTYSFVTDYKLVITKVDETKCRGVILNACHYAKRPLAYVTTGQNVPDDMEAADMELIANQILER